MSKSYWIWHPGAFELYHSTLLHNRRTSARKYENGDIRSLYYPPMWRVDSPSHSAELRKTATVTKSEEIELIANTDSAYICVDDKKYPPRTKITVEAGTHTVEIGGYKLESFPAFYVLGDTFASDRTYVSCNENNEPRRHAGYSELYTDPCDVVEKFKFSYERLAPVSTEKENGGILYDFGKETFGKIIIEGAQDGESAGFGQVAA